MAKTALFAVMVLAAVCGAYARPRSVFNWQNVTNSVLWVPQEGLDCRATCTNSFMQPVGAYKPSNDVPNPPLLCAHIGQLVADPTLTVPGSLATDPYKFFLSEGYTQPVAANKTSGRPAEFDPKGCSSYLEGTTPQAQNFLCGCVPPRKNVNGAPQKAWRWVPAATADCSTGGVPFSGFFAPFICRVTATGLLGHLNTQNCGFPSAKPIPDCEYGGATWDVQPASKFTNPSLNMPLAKPNFADCVYITRTGVQGSTPDIAGWNTVDKLCILSSFKYYIYRWPKANVNP